MNKNLSFFLQFIAAAIGVMAMIFNWGIILIILCLLVITVLAVYTPNSENNEKK